MGNNYLEVMAKDIEVLCVSTRGIKNSSKAFKELESKLPTLKGRKFYGVLEGLSKTGIYRACVALETTDDFEKFEKWIIPGGKYARAKIKDWEKHIEVIGKTFSDMSEKCKVDSMRPSVEFYRSQKELILFLPTK